MYRRIVSQEIFHQAKLAIKDEYTFDFLEIILGAFDELGEEHSERELEWVILGGNGKFPLTFILIQRKNK